MKRFHKGDVVKELETLSEITKETIDSAHQADEMFPSHGTVIKYFGSLGNAKNIVRKSRDAAKQKEFIFT
jgi:hypothetical protein